MAKEKSNNPNEQNSNENPNSLEVVVAHLKEQLKQSQDQAVVLQQQLQQRESSEQLKVQEEEQRKAEAEEARLVAEADLKTTLGAVEGDKVEQLTNRELVNIIAEAVDKTSTARAQQLNKLVEEKVDGLNQQIAATQKGVMSIATAIDVNAVRAEHDDFDEFHKEAAVIMQEIPGISVKRAYQLAKADAVGKTPPKKNLERERPGSVVSRSADDRLAEVTERRERQKTGASERKRGIPGVRDIISAGIDKTLAQRGEM